jgi:uncharacterized protein
MKLHRSDERVDAGYASSVEAPFTAEKITELSALLGKIARWDGTALPVLVDEMDGFLTAAIAGPRMVLPSALMPLMLRTEDWSAWSGDEFERFMELLAFRSNNIAWALRQDNVDIDSLAEPAALQPVLLDYDDVADDMLDDAQKSASGEQDDNPDQLFLPGALWAHGFLRGVDAFIEDWRLSDASISSTVDLMLQPFIALAIPRKHWPSDLAMDSEDRNDWIAAAIWSVYDISDFYRFEAPLKTAPVRKTPAPRRNDPCPCGSGRKFKLCHGA